MSKFAAVSQLVAVALIMVISYPPFRAVAVNGNGQRELVGPGVGGLVVAAMIGALVIAKKRRRK